MYLQSEKDPVHYINILKNPLYLSILIRLHFRTKRWNLSGFWSGLWICDKRDLSSMEIESVTQDEEWKTYTLKYSHSEGNVVLSSALVQTQSGCVPKNTYEIFF